MNTPTPRQSCPYDPERGQAVGTPYDFSGLPPEPQVPEVQAEKPPMRRSDKIALVVIVVIVAAILVAALMEVIST